MPNFWKRKIKNTKKIADITGIDEEKIKELKNGEREIQGETMDKVLNAINKENEKTELEKAVEEEEIMRWIKETNFTSLIREFGYNSQKEVAKAIGTSQGNFSMLITGIYKRYTPTHKKIYDFFHDDFNKKVKKDKVDVNEPINKDIIDKAITFFKENKMEKLQEKLKISNNYQLAKVAGCSKSSLQNFFFGRYKYVSETMIKAYNNLTNALKNGIKEEKVENEQKQAKFEEKVETNINTPKDTKIDVNEPKNDEKQDNIKEEEENKEEKVEIKKTSTKKKLRRENKLLTHNCKKLAEINFDLLEKIAKRDITIEKLKKQIARYEILIDRLK